MRILHVVPGLNEPTNGIAVAAKRIAAEQGADLVETRDFVSSSSSNSHSKLQLASYDEIWVHSNWWLPTIRACLKVLRLKSRSDLNLRQMPALVRMPHANLDPKRMWSKGWKKLPIWWLIERRLMNRAARVVVTCEAEREWCVRAGVKGPFEIVDLKRFFDLNRIIHLGQTKIYNSQTIPLQLPTPTQLRVLYLGRPHPLKGVEFLEQAIKELNSTVQPLTSNLQPRFALRIVSDHTGEELEKDWDWCDVLCLPTLSENFGLVVAEALERGKRVITTDGAPAWAPAAAGEVEKVGGESRWRERLFYLDGYRNGSEEARVNLLKDALKMYV